MMKVFAYGKQVSNLCVIYGDVDARYKTKLVEVNTTLLANLDNVINKKYWEVCLTLTL
ncbi:MAG: hypothetical protein ACRAUR_10620 [Acinetobacter tandoii]|uniref:hypothetical protein n=1 Tax=Acinetobacter tandoii TaxID=202954 RepID=UPI003D6C3699